MRVNFQRRTRHNRSRSRPFPWRRFLIALIVSLLLAFGTLLLILSTGNVISTFWYYILPPVFVFIGLIIALLQWLFPISLAQSETPQMPLACELLRGSFRMGDESAANFPYITTPIQDAYSAAAQTLLGISSDVVDKQGILILGEANAGKTRLAFEALTQTLPKWPVLRWRPDYTLEKTQLGEIRHNKRLVIFIDDLQDYVPSLRRDSDGKALIGDSRTTTLLSLVETLIQDVQKVVIVATCRLEDETRVRAELGQLFAKLTVIPLHHFNVDSNNPEVAKIIADFQRHGSSHTEDWDGTLGSLVLGLSTKNSEYLKMQNDPATTVLHAMKLLVKANTLVHTERYLRTVCAEVFREKDFLIDEKTWQKAVNQLVLKQFVTEEVDESSHEVTLVIRKDSYFDRVITVYPTASRPYQLNQDFARLQKVFISLKDAVALVNLGIALSDLERYQEALDAFEQAIRLDPNFVPAYYNKGYLLSKLNRYDKALDAFEQAIRLDPNFAPAYYHISLILSNLKRHDEALVACEQIIRLDPNSVIAHNNYGNALSDLKRYNEALVAYEQAICLDPNLAFVYYNKGLTLSELKRYDEALDAFEQAVHLDPNFAPAYFNKGVVLNNLGKSREAEQAYEKARQLGYTG